MRKTTRTITRIDMKKGMIVWARDVIAENIINNVATEGGSQGIRHGWWCPTISKHVPVYLWMIGGYISCSCKELFELSRVRNIEYVYGDEGYGQVRYLIPTLERASTSSPPPLPHSPLYAYSAHGHLHILLDRAGLLDLSTAGAGERLPTSAKDVFARSFD